MRWILVWACAWASTISMVTAEEITRLQLVVMDPLAKELSCPCVAGYAQRDYQALAKHLEAHLRLPVSVTFSESLKKGIQDNASGRADLVIGKHSVILADAKSLQLNFKPTYALTDLLGTTTMTGMVVVTKADPAKTLDDLKAYNMILGPAECDEKHAAALTLFQTAGISLQPPYNIVQACGEGCIAVLKQGDQGRTAAVISSYAAPLVEGCGTIPKDSIRVVAHTQPVPFITAFVSQSLDEGLRTRLSDAFEAVASDAGLLKKLESLGGFEEFEEQTPKELSATQPVKPSSNGDWIGWRGPHRDAVVAWLPRRFDKPPVKLWSHPLSMQGVGGVAATSETVFVTDRDADDTLDLLHAIDAKTGSTRWTYSRPAPGRLDYGNDARATPLIAGNQVIFFGAHGHLDVLDVGAGQQTWGLNVAQLYGLEAKLPWGYCGTPVIVDQTLIVNPGGIIAGMAAFDLGTGDERWIAETSPPAYGSYLHAQIAGRSQIIGVDATHVRGFDPLNGTFLWEFVPDSTDDFQVPTPIVWKNHLILISETMGTRLHCFDADGKLIFQPVAVNRDISPDTHSPVVVGDRLYGIHEDLICLDLTNGLKEIDRVSDPRYGSHSSLIASQDRLLVFTHDAQLHLFDIKQTPMKLLGRHQVLDNEYGLLTHPAIVGNTLYIRGSTQTVALEFAE